MRAILERLKNSVRSMVTAGLKVIKLPVTPMLILKALLGILVFFIGIICGIWLIIRYRRRVPE